MDGAVDALPRAPLSRDRVLRAAVARADEAGLDALSMRKLAQELGVVPMALYKHVANKEQLLDGMIDVVVAEIEDPAPGAGWKAAVRQRILCARRVLLRHPWASQVIESRVSPTPATLRYLDSMIGTLRRGGFSVDLTHHAIHALGSRLWGFSQEVYNEPPGGEADPRTQALMLGEMRAHYPHVTELAMAVSHDDASVVGPGCDDQFEFEFALDILLDGLDRLRDLHGQPGGVFAERPTRPVPGT
ncbi:TetR/AcrR family transcriptional regulator C-terminal domain-containing protein [Actinoplanes sp. NPDC026623]|uniref:TetR/AcrR family transcriptional regulator C-terminal domain-containing protein n=1 Tax=Actinoplanes sp. NPDC026623 TaxID=3155610 RepID=UPI0033C7BDAA